MAKAPSGPTVPEAGVMAASPAMAPVAKPSALGLPFLIHSIKNPRQRRDAGRDLGDYNRHGRLPIGCQGTAAIEAEPPHPEHGRADEVHGHVVRGHGLLGIAGALADEDRGDQRGRSGGDVDDDAAGKVKNAHCTKVAALSPDHVRDGQINQNAPQPR